VEQWLKSAIQRKPKALALLLHLADYYDFQGNYGEAERTYRRILEQDADNVMALNNLAWLLALQADRGTEALTLIQRAIDRSGRQPALLDTRGVAYLALRQPEAALADLKEVVGDAASATRYLHLARAYHLAGHREAAREALRQARALRLDLQQLHPLERPVYQPLIDELVPVH
jgi:tetratricopeptide (TPR) repeat protein